MRLLLTGANGMLARDLSPLLENRGHAIAALSRYDLDITKVSEVERAIARHRPDLVIHCAAYTKVDQAENDPHLTFAVNAFGTQNIALACQLDEIPLLYISTDYVFDGRSERPYHEYATTNPINVYGESKRAGEAYVTSLLRRFYVVRTSWLFGQHGPNFVQTMLKLAAEKEELNVVTDQVGSPTWTGHLSEAIAHLIETGRFGIYHATGSGCCSWFDFAREIFTQTGHSTRVLPTTSDQMQRPAPRPANSCLSPRALHAAGFQMPSWQEGLSAYLTQLGLKA